MGVFMPKQKTKHTPAGSNRIRIVEVGNNNPEIEQLKDEIRLLNDQILACFKKPSDLPYLRSLPPALRQRLQNLRRERDLCRKE